MTGFVYAIGDSERVKIGWSKDPLRRLDKIRSDCPDAAHLLGLIPATRAQEEEAHKLLVPWRIQREWFRHEGAVAAFIRMLPRPEPKSVNREWPPSACQPAASVISVLGGLSAVANAAEVSVTSVQRWRFPTSKKGGSGGIIPAKYYKRLIKHAASLGVALPLAAFVDPEAAARLVAAE